MRSKATMPAGAEAGLGVESLTRYLLSLRPSEAMFLKAKYVPQLLQVFLAVVALLLSPAAAEAEKRIGLLIGNQAYKSELGVLKNPHQDITVVGAALSRIGFELVEALKDANRDQIIGAVYDYARQLGAAGPDAVGFLYYSGHGIAAGGDNFIIPVDVNSTTRRDLDVSGVKLADILKILNEGAPEAAHFVVFDACRNNLGGTRGGKGFVPAGERPGMLIAFSTAPGATASDQGKESGPYASALAAELVIPGRSHSDTFFEVRSRVAASSSQEQIPWTQDGLLRRVYFAATPVNVPKPTSQAHLALASEHATNLAKTEGRRKEFSPPTINGFPLAFNSPGLESNKGVADAFCLQEGYERALAYLARPTDGRKQPVMKLRGGELCGDSSCLTLTRIDCVGPHHKSIYSPPLLDSTSVRATFIDPSVDGFAISSFSPGLETNKGVADAFCQDNGFASAIAHLSRSIDGRKSPIRKLRSGELCADSNCLTLTRIDCSR